MRILLIGDLPRPGHLQPGQSVHLDEEESHHLLNVLRKVQDTEVRLTDGQGYFYHGRVQGKRAGRAKIQILASWPDETAREKPRLVLVCAMAKGRRFEWALEKSVELGVHRIWPLQTERTVIRPREGKIGRWQHILRTALKQTGRSLLPELMPVSGLAGCLAGLGGGRLFFGVAPAAAAAGGPPLPPEALPSTDRVVRLGPQPSVDSPVGGGELLRQTRPGGELPDCLTWLVGPEGGWTESESDRLATSGAVPVHLGPHPMRTETAAVAGLVLLQALRRQWLDSPDRAP